MGAGADGRQVEILEPVQEIVDHPESKRGPGLAPAMGR